MVLNHVKHYIYESANHHHDEVSEEENEIDSDTIVGEFSLKLKKTLVS